MKLKLLYTIKYESIYILSRERYNSIDHLECILLYQGLKLILNMIFTLLCLTINDLPESCNITIKKVKIKN